MLSTTIDADQVLSVVDNVIKPDYLNKVQELVLRQTLEGKTYSEIASIYCYDSEYIKSVGCELWQLLSKSFGESVTKSNFQQFIRRYINSPSYNKNSSVSVVLPAGTATKISQQEMLAPSPLERHPLSRQDWGTAPDLSTFQGRSKELALLTQWSQNNRCRLAIVSGLIGCGKTLLAAKFAEQLQQQFDYVIWRSLRNAPPVHETLDNILRFLSNDWITELPEAIDDKNLWLLQYLRQHRCLLILDDLQSVLDSSHTTTHYLRGCEGYGQLFRSIVSTHHQSFVVATSWDKPRGLALYEGEQVQFLGLKGLSSSALRTIFQERIKAGKADPDWQTLLERYAYNPQFLKIATSNIQAHFGGSIAQYLQRRSALTEDMRMLLDRQFDRLPTVEKKLAYWLAIERSVSVEQLATQLRQPGATPRLLESLISLEERSLVTKENNIYVLHPLILEYLSSKLIDQIWEGNFTENSQAA